VAGGNVADVLIPYAKTHVGELIAPSQASAGSSYLCPECGGTLSVRGGDAKKKRRHFFHVGKPPNCDLTGESALHAAAKHAVYYACWSWLHQQAEAPSLLIASCRRHGLGAERRNLPDGIAAVHLEHRVPSQAGVIIGDVVLVNPHGDPKLIIEIKKAHAVDEHKAQRISDIPWVELDAEYSLKSPRGWYPLQSGGGLITYCQLCAEDNRKRAEEAREQAEARQRAIKRDRHIPYALRADADRIVLPERANVGQNYRCPECRKPLLCEKNAQGDLYFYHPALCDCGFMYSGSAVAQHTLFLRLRLWLAGRADAPEVVVGCRRCVIEEPIDVSQAKAVKLNWPITRAGGKPGIGQVVLLDGDGKLIVVLAVSWDMASVAGGIPWIMFDHVPEMSDRTKPLTLVGTHYKNVAFRCLCNHPTAKRIKVYSRRSPAVYGCPKRNSEDRLSLSDCRACTSHFGDIDFKNSWAHRYYAPYADMFDTTQFVLCGYPTTVSQGSQFMRTVSKPMPRGHVSLPKPKSKP
jgi:ssDNA-binding Zn-finger/Zn-ribbon topoisomerase 1